MAEVRRSGATIVLVPTMGSLHEGHLSLFEIAGKVRSDRNLFVVGSIFVNPLQFGPGGDYDIYPRNLRRDVELLSGRSCDAVFAPSVKEMYGAGGETQVVVNRLSEPLCGAHRPGHFEGVLTVVAKLFLIVQPDIAVFGQKDAQQALIIKRMIDDLGFPVELLLGPTVRSSDGLAESSRNTFLSPEQRSIALGLYRALQAVRDSLIEGERSVVALEDVGRRVLVDSGLDRIDYFEIRKLPELVHPEEARGHLLVATSAFVGRTRLIDNLVLQVDGESVIEAALF